MDERTYGYTTDVRYRDLDPRGHVNHVVYVSYMEQAKGAFLEDVVGVTLDEVNTVVRSLDVDYERSIESGQQVTVDLRVESVGETSFTITYRLNADGDEVATARTVSVLLDEEGSRVRSPSAGDGGSRSTAAAGERSYRRTRSNRRP
ncbi:acyl-CoA thioesterase [Halalkalicoccus salilacus]|uniref:acyl-CoA thioesterase n=1 Tax=Halalkalicoccus sp. GCM10025704 TaxID=3252662 RepID=UPI0036F3EAB6